MLEEYFSFTISDEGGLESLPLLLPGFMPDLDKLPLRTPPSPACKLHVCTLTTSLACAVLLRLALQVDWTDEKGCFDSFLRELAYFYSLSPSPISDKPTSALLTSSQEEMQTEEQTLHEDQKKRQIQHVVWPTVKQYLVAPEGMLKKEVIQLTSLEALFRV